MYRVFKTRHFSRWMRKTELTDEALCSAVHEMSQGLIDADLGAGVVKKRVAMAGRGKRGGARTLVAHDLLSRTRQELDAAVAAAALQEICHDHQDPRSKPAAAGRA